MFDDEDMKMFRKKPEVKDFREACKGNPGSTECGDMAYKEITGNDSAGKEVPKVQPNKVDIQPPKKKKSFFDL